MLRTKDQISVLKLVVPFSQKFLENIFLNMKKKPIQITIKYLFKDILMCVTIK